MQRHLQPEIVAEAFIFLKRLKALKARLPLATQAEKSWPFSCIARRLKEVMQ